MTTTEDLDHLTVQMLTPASRLVAGVHEFDRQTCHQVLEGLSPLELRALCVTLAALVPRGDVALDVLSSWTRRPARLEGAASAGGRRVSRTSLREAS